MGTNKIAITNHKGGVGKTTTTINLAAGLTKLNKKVLVIDLDPQANLTCSMGINPDEQTKTIYEILTGDMNAEQCIIDCGGIHVIPANLELSGIVSNTNNKGCSEYLLSKTFENLNTYDYILIDTAPTLNVLTINALVFATQIFVPMQTQFLSLYGISSFTKTLSLINSKLSTALKINAVVATMYEKRKNFHNEVLNELKKHFGNKLLKTVIRSNVALGEATGNGVNIFEYSNKSNGAQDYLNLSKEIIRGDYGD